MNVDFFSWQSFLDRVFEVSYTCSSNYSVYDGRCTYTHLLHVHFSAHSACTVTFAHFSCVSHTRMAQGHEKFVCCMCVISLHLAFSLLMFHPSLLFLHTHLDITFLSVFLPNFPVLKAQDMRNSAHASRRLATWPSQMQTHSSEGSPRASRRWSSCRTLSWVEHVLMKTRVSSALLLAWIVSTLCASFQSLTSVHSSVLCEPSRTMSVLSEVELVGLSKKHAVYHTHHTTNRTASSFLLLSLSVFLQRRLRITATSAIELLMGTDGAKRAVAIDGESSRLWQFRRVHLLGHGFAGGWRRRLGRIVKRCKLVQLRCFSTQLWWRAVSESEGLESIEIVGGMPAWCEEGVARWLWSRVWTEPSRSFHWLRSDWSFIVV